MIKTPFVQPEECLNVQIASGMPQSSVRLHSGYAQMPQNHPRVPRPEANFHCNICALDAACAPKLQSLSGEAGNLLLLNTIQQITPLMSRLFPAGEKKIAGRRAHSSQKAPNFQP
jgi:hypothetical protein